VGGRTSEPDHTGKWRRPNHPGIGASLTSKPVRDEDAVGGSLRRLRGDFLILPWRRPGPPRLRRREKTHAPERESQGSFLATAIYGYVVFLAIVLVFHVGWRGNPTRSSAPFGVDSSDR
jgi:hypothetical protein